MFTIFLYEDKIYGPQSTGDRSWTIVVYGSIIAKKLLAVRMCITPRINEGC